MKPYGTIAGLSLRLLFRQKQAFLWMLVVPVLYITIFGSAFREGGRHRTKALLSVIDRDGGSLTRRFLAGIDTSRIALKIETDTPADSPIRLLHIPTHLTENLLNGGKDTLLYETRSDANLEANLAVSWSLRKGTYRILFDLAELKVRNLPLCDKSFETLDRRDPLIRIRTETAGRYRRIPVGLRAQVPAQIVQFVLLFLFIYAGNFLLAERRAGLIRRMRIAPVSWTHLYLGKLVGAGLMGCLQIGVLLIVGRFGFGVTLGHSLGGLLLLSVVFAFATASMGLILGFLISHPEKLTGIAIVLALAMAALSGCWWPIEITPVWMQKAALFLPSGLALRAYHRLVSFGDGFREIVPYLVGEVGFALFFALLFAWILSRRIRGEAVE